MVKLVSSAVRAEEVARITPLFESIDIATLGKAPTAEVEDPIVA